MFNSINRRNRFQFAFNTAMLGLLTVGLLLCGCGDSNSAPTKSASSKDTAPTITADRNLSQAAENGNIDSTVDDAARDVEKLESEKLESEKLADETKKPTKEGGSTTGDKPKFIDRRQPGPPPSEATPALTLNDVPPMNEEVTDGSLPDAELPPESSDPDLEPTYVDPRKHEPVFAVEEDWAKLSPDYPIWADLKNKQLVVDGRIAQVQAALEMFACPVACGKEHESIVGVFSDSKLVHAGLLAVGGKPGLPVQFEPAYKPATGSKVMITIQWEQDGVTKSLDAKEMIRDWQTKEVLTVDWVFGGSMIYSDPDSGEQFYLADGGEMVCVSNFSTAMLDLPILSSADASNQVFETNTDKIPPLGTLVRLFLKPVPGFEPQPNEKSPDPLNDAPPKPKQLD